MSEQQHRERQPYPEDWESRRLAILDRDNHRCVRCHEFRDESMLHVHHKTPISEGGGHDLDNLELLCATCHAAKHDTQPCDVCSLVGHYLLDEVKHGGSVGLVHLCGEHYDALAERREVDEFRTASGPPARPEGRCVFCTSEASGKYSLHDHGRWSPSGALVCRQCRKLLVFGGQSAQSELQDRIEEVSGDE